MIPSASQHIAPVFPLPAPANDDAARAALESLLNWTARPEAADGFTSPDLLRYLRAWAAHATGRAALTNDDAPRALACAQEGLLTLWRMKEIPAELEKALLALHGEAERATAPPLALPDQDFDPEAIRRAWDEATPVMQAIFEGLSPEEIDGDAF